MIIQQKCFYEKGTQPVGGLRICSRARPVINRHFRYKFNHQSRRQTCISNIQRLLGSERPMCPVLLIRPFDKQFRLRTQIVHQASLSANVKAPKGVGRASITAFKGDLCIQSRTQLCLIWFVNSSVQSSSKATMTSNYNKKKLFIMFEYLIDVINNLPPPHHQLTKQV